MAETKPEDMNPEELRAFVRRALAEAKARPLPDDLRKWWEASRPKARDWDRRVR